MNALARRVIAGHIGATDPQLERNIRRRLADHLVATAGRRGISVAADLSQLYRPEWLGRGFRWHDGLHARLAVPGDIAHVESAFARAGDIETGGTRCGRGSSTRPTASSSRPRAPASRSPMRSRSRRRTRRASHSRTR